MTGKEMLALLDEHGADAGSDFNDHVMGWFGWSISHQNGDTVLAVSFQAEDLTTVARRWRLEPLDG
jgi:hypothetical protein